jgi:hypothetical protein
MHDRITEGAHTFAQHVILPLYFLQKLLRCAEILGCYE